MSPNAGSRKNTPAASAPGRAVQEPPHVDRELVRLGAREQHREVQRVEEAASPIHRRRSTSSVCISAIWPVGPPKFTKPSQTQNPNASANGTRGEPREIPGAGCGWSLPPYRGWEPAPKPCRRLGTMPRVGTDTLVIHGAREHNLKNITFELPRNA